MRTRRSVGDDWRLSSRPHFSEVGQPPRIPSTVYSPKRGTYILNRSASLSRIRLNSCEVNSLNFRSRRGRGAVCTSCKWKAPSLRNGFGIVSSHLLPRSAVVWKTTVTRSRSWSVGASVIIRQGRIFATYPASITQISPGCGLILGILRFSSVNLLTGRNQKIISKFHFFLFGGELKNPAGNCPSLRFVQLRQFCYTLCCAHDDTTTESPNEGNLMRRLQFK